MAAPTNAAYVKKALANSEPSEVVECPLLRRCWGTSGPPIYELWRRRPLNVAAHRESASARLLASERICSCGADCARPQTAAVHAPSSRNSATRSVRNAAASSVSDRIAARGSSRRSIMPCPPEQTTRPRRHPERRSPAKRSHATSSPPQDRCFASRNDRCWSPSQSMRPWSPIGIDVRTAPWSGTGNRSRDGNGRPAMPFSTDNKLVSVPAQARTRPELWCGCNIGLADVAGNGVDDETREWSSSRHLLRSRRGAGPRHEARLGIGLGVRAWYDDAKPL